MATATVIVEGNHQTVLLPPEVHLDAEQVFVKQVGDSVLLVPKRAELERRGTPIGSLDMLIGAHGVSQSLIVVTHNTSEFARIPGLQIEDWALEP